MAGGALCRNRTGDPPLFRRMLVPTELTRPFYYRALRSTMHPIFLRRDHPIVVCDQIFRSSLRDNQMLKTHFAEWS
jgi:hypothetical protein